MMLQDLKPHIYMHRLGMTGDPMTQRWRPIGTSLTASPFRHRLYKRVLKPAIVGLAALAGTGVASFATAQPVNCDAYARSYANAHVNPDPAD
jgi:hypothetical protein